MDDNPIPLACSPAGNASGSFFSGNYPRHIPGTSIGRAITFGYVAAESAVNGVIGQGPKLDGNARRADAIRRRRCSGRGAARIVCADGRLGPLQPGARSSFGVHARAGGIPDACAPLQTTIGLDTVGTGMTWKANS